MTKISHRPFCLRALSILLPAALSLAGLISAHAQNGATVRSIEVKYVGPQTLSRERILSQIRTKVGQPYSDTVVEQDIRGLYSSGSIQNVRIFGEPAGDGVKVTVVVQTRAMINEIEIDGATKVSAKRLRKEIGVKINTAVNESALQEGRQKIIDTYKGRGYNDIDVQFRVDTDDTRGTARVVFTINEGTKGTVSRINFEGNTIFSDRVLRKQMKTRGKTLIAFVDKSGRLQETQLQQDLDSIREYYQNHGYIDIEVKDVRRERVRGHMNIVIVVAEGPKYHVGKLTFSGEKATTEQRLRAVIKMKEGEVYSPKQLRDDAKTISDAYGRGGYVDLMVAPKGAPGGPQTIDVSYKIEEGTRSFVQRINIIGNTRTKDKVIRREIGVAPGEVYDTVRVDISKKRLENLGYFTKVDTYPEDTGVVGRKDLTVQVDEKRTGSLNFGAGYSTVDSLVGFIELTQGNFDILNWPALTGGGEKFRARVQYGATRQDFTVGLTEPYFLDRRLSLGGEAYYHEADFLSSVYNQRNYGVAFEIRKPIGSYMALTLGYRLEDIDIFDVAAGASTDIQVEKGSTVKSVVTPSLIIDRRDNPFLTRRGQRISITPYVSGGPLGGDIQIYGFDVTAAQYFHLPLDLILLLNGEVAGVNTWGGPETRTVTTLGPGTPPTVITEEISNVRIFDRLFLGGSNDLRGFAFRDVSPKDIHGEPIGGQSLARGTVEVTFPIVEKARGAIFYDTGFVNKGPFDYSNPDIASDYGIGIRLDLPIGPLRLDYGIPLQQAGNNGGGRFNFNVGYQF
ncbi:MAG: outer membrane protein insertion porin family [Verrucomicrobiota bacterium]|jgi:outer membrane protein insertion porin family